MFNVAVLSLSSVEEHEERVIQVLELRLEEEETSARIVDSCILEFPGKRDYF